MTIHQPNTVEIGHAADALLRTRLRYQDMRKAIQWRMALKFSLQALGICKATWKRVQSRARNLPPALNEPAEHLVRALLIGTPGGPDFRKISDAFDWAIAMAALRETDGDATAAAKILKMHRNSVRSLMARGRRSVDINKSEVA